MGSETSNELLSSEDLLGDEDDFLFFADEEDSEASLALAVNLRDLVDLSRAISVIQNGIILLTKFGNQLLNTETSNNSTHILKVTDE